MSPTTFTISSDELLMHRLNALYQSDETFEEVADCLTEATVAFIGQLIKHGVAGEQIPTALHSHVESLLDSMRQIAAGEAS